MELMSKHIFGEYLHTVCMLYASLTSPRLSSHTATGKLIKRSLFCFNSLVFNSNRNTSCSFDTLLKRVLTLKIVVVKFIFG